MCSSLQTSETRQDERLQERAGARERSWLGGGEGGGVVGVDGLGTRATQCVKSYVHLRR